jgi:CheY-like chemotaxis protein
MTIETAPTTRDAPLPPRILIIDDEVGFCKALELVLAYLPARVESVHNGNDAVDRLLASAEQADPFKLIVLDMWAPSEANGMIDEHLGLKILIDLQEHYQLIPYEAPIIVFTNHPNYEACVKCIQAGAVGYLPKTDLESGTENTEKLFDLCREILGPLRGSPHPLRRWLDYHLGELVDRYGGQFVGVIPEPIARQAGLTGDPVGEYVLLPGSSGNEVRLQILKDRILRWEIIPIIGIPTPEG